MDRLLILERIKKKQITQVEGALQLNLSTRQVRRLLKRLAEEGPSGLKRRPSGGNRAHKPEFKKQVLSLVKNKYAKLGPSCAAQKLKEFDDIQISKESLRQLMIKAGLWRARKRKIPLIK